jgi:hypothetical protein
MREVSPLARGVIREVRHAGGVCSKGYAAGMKRSSASVTTPSMPMEESHAAVAGPFIVWFSAHRPLEAAGDAIPLKRGYPTNPDATNPAAA